MKTTLHLTLERPARRGGGDRYETNPTETTESFQIYLPQTISRIAGVPIGKFEMTIEAKGGD